MSATTAQWLLVLVLIAATTVSLLMTGPTEAPVCDCQANHYPAEAYTAFYELYEPMLVGGILFTHVATLVSYGVLRGDVLVALGRSGLIIEPIPESPDDDIEGLTPEELARYEQELVDFDPSEFDDDTTQPAPPLSDERVYD